MKTLADFFMLNSQPISEGDLICGAILVYSAFMTTNYDRINGTTSAEIAYDALVQHCKNAAQGHEGTMKVLDMRWVRVTTQPSKRRRTSYS